MASRNNATAASRAMPPPPSNARPGLHPQHSSSVPSTPSQYPRDLAYRSRTPSPTTDLGNHSPRSVVSEANDPMTSLRKNQSGCKFETKIALGKRRIPYSIGTDLLERPKTAVKAALDPEEDKKLSGDMRELYDRLLPTEESERRRKELVIKLENILKQQWPGTEFKVHVFGSSGNMLCTTDSDVDICIQTPMRKLESMHMLAEVLYRNGMEKVVCVSSANVPIVRIWDPVLCLACDMNVNNTMALENTRLIKTYVQIDERVRPLAMIVKHWTKQRILNDAALGGTLSSYTWICMILNFLQTRKPPILPSLHKLARKRDASEVNLHSEFADNVESLRSFGAKNKETLGELLFQFFKSYGFDINFGAHVVSVREGRLVSRKEKGWDVRSLTKEARHRLCVEEPFNTARNLGNSADDIAWRGIHLELRRAFDLLADRGQLSEACEQYEFPPEEKVIFRKPAPTPKPVLQSAPAPNRGNRGPTNSRAGRIPGQKNNHNYRRASSAASFGSQRPQMNLQGPPMAPLGADLYGARPQAQARAQVQAFYSGQSPQLGQRAQGASMNQARTVSSASSPKPPYFHAQSSASPQEPILGPLTPGIQQYLYPYPTFGTEPMAFSLSHDPARADPPSPALASAGLDFRRGSQRVDFLPGSPGASARSHSQPARVMPIPLPPQGFPPVPQLDPTTLMGYQTQSSAEMIAPQATASVAAQSDQPSPMVHSMEMTPSTQKEYVGYYVDEAPLVQPSCLPPAQSQLRDVYAVPRIPSYQEISQRRRNPAAPAKGTSPALTLDATVGGSTGSSISQPSQSQVAPVDVTPKTASQPRNPPTEYADLGQLNQNGGLLIMNDSDSAPVEPGSIQNGLRSSQSIQSDRTGPVIVNGSGSRETATSSATIEPTTAPIREQLNAPASESKSHAKLPSPRVNGQRKLTSPNLPLQPAFSASPALNRPVLNELNTLVLQQPYEPRAQVDMPTSSTLSPVAEVSTNSPVSSRRRPAFGEMTVNGAGQPWQIAMPKLNENKPIQLGRVGMLNGHHAGSTGKASAPSEQASQQPPAQLVPSPNQWQQSTGGKRGKGKKKAMGVAEGSSSVVPLSVGDMERKGG